MARIEIDVQDRRVVQIDVPIPPNLIEEPLDVTEVQIMLWFPGTRRPRKVTVPGHWFMDGTGPIVGEAP